MYDDELRRLADRFTPATTLKVTRRQRIAVWYDDESRQMRRSSHALERRYRRTGLEADRVAWILIEKERRRINRIKEELILADLCIRPQGSAPQTLENVLLDHGTEQGLRHTNQGSHGAKTHGLLHREN